MEIGSKIKNWIWHGEWIVFMGVLTYLFVFVHHENVHLNERLDSHMAQINTRSDDLHKEFYDLLKEMRK